MRVNPDRLLPVQHSLYYLFGEDHDALFEAAESLLAAGDGSDGAHRMRVDINELARIEEQSRNQGLFGPSCCYALVRNAQSANVKQAAHLLKLLHSLSGDHRLIVCAPGIDWKKALHKKMQAESTLAQCEFNVPNEAGFKRWLDHELQVSALEISPEAVLWMAESLHGMRLAARQMIERLRWYDGGKGEMLGLDVVAELLGERAPDALEDWCHAIAMRQPKAIVLAQRLLRDQQVAEVQMISWLGTRIQQLLMYCWFQAKHERNPLQAAKVFGDARKLVGQEAALWSGSDLTLAMQRIVQAEKLIKGASVEDKGIVIEQLTLHLIDQQRLLAA